MVERRVSPSSGHLRRVSFFPVTDSPLSLDILDATVPEMYVTSPSSCPSAQLAHPEGGGRKEVRSLEAFHRVGGGSRSSPMQSLPRVPAVHTGSKQEDKDLGASTLLQDVVVGLPDEGDVMKEFALKSV